VVLIQVGSDDEYDQPKDGELHKHEPSPVYGSSFMLLMLGSLSFTLGLRRNLSNE
jgi:hypothetical protein